MILAKRGFDVSVYEAKSVVGGRNAAIRADGFTFDTGPTFLMMRFILAEMFQEAGRDVEKYLTFKKLDPLYRLRFEDREVAITSNHAAMRREIGRVFPGKRDGVRSLSERRGRAIRKTLSLHPAGLLFPWFFPVDDPVESRAGPGDWAIAF
jgi:phytoene desaturase